MLTFIGGAVAGVVGACAALWVIFAWDHIKPNNW